MRIFARAPAERARHILVSPPQARDFGRFGAHLRRTAWSSVQGVKSSHGNVVLHLPHQKSSRHACTAGRRPCMLNFKLETCLPPAAGKPAGRTLIGSGCCFSLIVSGPRKMSAQRPRIRSQHENATFFASPPPFHSLRKPFCVRRKRPPALLSEIWLDLA